MESTANCDASEPIHQACMEIRTQTSG